jgi:hypothetical protein
MSNVNVQLTATALQVIDNTGTVTRVNTPVAALVAALTAASYTDYYIVGTSPTGLGLPSPGVTAFQFAWIKNNHAVNTVTVTPTPVAGGTPLGYIIQPGGVFFYANPATTAGGLSAITLVASGASTPCELLLGG